MFKKELFYLIFGFFFIFPVFCFAQSNGLFDSAPVTGEKTDAFWDLAWHARLADYGDMESQFIIADAYEKGQVTQRNMKKAVIFYEKAAKNGHLESMMRLGHLYEEGKNVQSDKKKAFDWYKQAAQHEYVPAQLKTAEFYQTKGFLDYKAAYYWLAKAMKNMFPTEKDLEKVSPDLKKVAFQLTSEQYRQVQDELR